MKICLVQCPSLTNHSPLLGLAYINAALKTAGHEVHIKDFSADKSDTVFENDPASFKANLDKSVNSVLETEAEVVGFSVWETNFRESLLLAKEIKKKNARITTVFGGPHCTFFGRELIQDVNVDAVVVGEGEETIVELLGSLTEDGRIVPCPGVLVKSGGSVLDGGRRPEIKAVDSLSFPDYRGFEIDRYIHKDHIFSIAFSRGCIRKCKFCTNPASWESFRRRSAKQVTKEMRWQKECFPELHKLEVQGAAINLDIEMLSELCDEIIRTGLNIKWGGSLLIRKEMTAELIAKMAKAGCNCLGFSLESGSQKIVDSMGKGFQIADADRIIKAAHEAGIETILTLIVGFPGETQSDFSETMSFIERNKTNISWMTTPSECVALKNSYISDHPDEMGIELSQNGTTYWRSKDGSNTHEERQRRLAVLKEFAESEGLTVDAFNTIHLRNMKQ